MKSDITIDTLVNWYLEYYGIEQWRPVKGDLKHEISNLGRCRRILLDGNGKVVDEVVHAGSLGKHGYRVYSIQNKLAPASRLVAQAFPEICGDWFDGCEVHHIDGNPLNNKATNLMVLSRERHKAIHQTNLIELYDWDWTYIRSFPHHKAAAKYLKCSIEDVYKSINDTSYLCQGYHCFLAH